MVTRQQKRLREEEELREQKKMKQEAAESLKNPLLNDTVVTRMFEVCCLKDLRQFRLVSKQWYSLSLPILRNQMTFRINLLNCNERCSCNDLEYRYYVPRIDNMQIGDHPFDAYSFCGFKFQHYEIPPETQLLDKFGPWMRKLTLNHGVLCCLRALEQLLFDKTPNLEELQMGHFDVFTTRCSEKNECERPKYSQKRVPKNDLQVNLKSLVLTSGMAPFPISWNVMFIRFPNIERIHFTSGFSSKRDFLPFVEALEEKKWSGTQMIKDVKFDSRFNNEECTSAAKRLLRLPRVQLEVLSIICRKSDEEDADRTDVLQLALQIHGRNLKKLEIQNGRMMISTNEVELEPYLDFPFQVDSFESMAELTLEGVVTPSLQFLLQFPNLKVLLIRQNREDRILGGTDFDRLKSLVLPHVHHLEFRVFNTTDFQLSEENMKMFVKMMPNVDYFEGNLMPPGLRVVCRSWRRMRKLDIFVNDTNKEEEPGEENNEMYEPIFKWQGKCLPNIKKLDDLQKELSPGVPDDPATAWTGFEELPFLHTLNVKIISRVVTGRGRRV